MQLYIKGNIHEVTKVKAKSYEGKTIPAKTVITFIGIDSETGNLESFSIKASEHCKLEKGKNVELPVKLFVGNNQAYFSLVE